MLFGLLALLALGVFVGPVHGSGLVQVSLRGEVGAQSGTMIEFTVKSGSHDLQFSGMVGEGTRVGDLAALFERKLKRAGFSVTVGVDAGGRGPVSLFIDEVEEIRVRVGGGLSATVTSSEEMPLEVRALPPRVKSDFGGGSFRAFVTVTDPETSGFVIHSLDARLPDRNGTSESVASELVKDAVRQGVTSAQPQSDCWTAKGAASGGEAVAFSVALYSDVDWGVELVLAPLVGAR